ncbi:MAG: DUF1801 domain-containing protein [Tardiphaga sp.]
MAELKTKATQTRVEDFIAAIDHPVRRADAEVLVALLERVTGAPATMWGPSIIGFGRYHYRYDSGHEGEMCRIGFSPRKANLVLYIMPGFAGRDRLLGRRGKHRMGKSCLYVNQLAEVDIVVIEEIARAAWAYMGANHPD